METAKALLVSDRNVAEFSLVYNGYGICKYHSCEFSAAHEAFLTALDAAKRIGDDSRASIITGNLSSVLATMGDYEGAVGAGIQSVRYATRTVNQPFLWMSFTELAEARMLSGDRAAAIECLERAQELVRTSQRWSATVEFCCQVACVALLMGNLELALKQVEAAEEAAWGKERIVPNAGVFAKLKIFRAAHIAGLESAQALAYETKAKFRDCHPWNYLCALAATAWVERRAQGAYRLETAEELSLFSKPALAGFAAREKAMGFLE